MDLKEFKDLEAMMKARPHHTEKPRLTENRMTSFNEITKGLF